MDDAIKLLEDTVEQERQSEGRQDRQTLRAMQHLAVAYSRAGQLDRAAALLEEVVQGRQQVNGSGHPDTLEAMLIAGDVQFQRTNYAAAEPLLLEAHQGFAKRLTAGSTPFDEEQLQSAVKNLVRLYEKSNQPEKAAAWKEKLHTLDSGTVKE